MKAQDKSGKCLFWFMSRPCRVQQAQHKADGHNLQWWLLRVCQWAIVWGGTKPR